jgi:hypothetical protein
LDALEAAVDATLAAAEAALCSSMGCDGSGGAAFPVPKNPSSQASAKRTASAVLGLPEARRESYGAARVLRHKLDMLARGGDCRRCWLKPTHCVCASCPPLVRDVTADDGEVWGTQVAHVETTGAPALPAAAALLSAPPGAAAAAAAAAAFPVRRLFVLMHHKEVGLAVDTAKLLLAAYPEVARLAVGGLGGHDARVGGLGGGVGVRGRTDESGGGGVGTVAGEICGVGGGVQPAYQELVQALAFRPNAIVLFPTHAARPFADVAAAAAAAEAAAAAAAANAAAAAAPSAAAAAAGKQPRSEPSRELKWDVVVVDGTWEQARKLHARLLGHVKEAQQQAQQQVQQQAQGLQGDAQPAAQPAEVTHVCLSAAAVATLGAAAASGSSAGRGVAGVGLQLRRHPTPWREVTGAAPLRSNNL